MAEVDRGFVTLVASDHPGIEVPSCSSCYSFAYFEWHKKAIFAPQVLSLALVLVFSELHLLFCILLLFNLVNVFSWFLFDLIYCYALPLLLFICQFLLFIFFCRFAIQMVIGT